MKDLLQECMPEHRDLNPKSFQELFCAFCRNRNCSLARWGWDKFSKRVTTQAERLLNPTRIDPALYPKLANFKDMLETAIQIELADRKGDWVVPEISIRDGVLETATAATTSAVDAAAQVLAQSRGQELSLVVPQQEKVISEEPRPLPPPQKVQQGHSVPKEKNTPFPTEGLMLDGTTAPASTAQQPIVVDAWAVAPVKGQVVKPGARIQLGEKK